MLTTSKTLSSKLLQKLTVSLERNFWVSKSSRLLQELAACAEKASKKRTSEDRVNVIKDSLLSAAVRRPFKSVSDYISGQSCTLNKDLIAKAKFLLRSSLVSCLLITLVACDSQDSANTGGEFTAQSVDSTISGYYQLVSVNDESVPGIVNHRFTQLRIHAGDFTIRSDGSCSTRLEFSPPFGGKELRVSHCEYEQEGSQLTMRWLGAGQTVGELAGSSFSTDNQGMEFVFQRTQPIGSLTRLDLSDECDRHIKQSVAQTKGPRIVDDFSGELISGLNRQGLDIGFLTFQDSTTTRIAMSTTGKHPPTAARLDPVARLYYH